jgi:hypothetical protein
MKVKLSSEKLAVHRCIQVELKNPLTTSHVGELRKKF